MRWTANCPLDSILRPLYNWAQMEKTLGLALMTLHDTLPSFKAECDHFHHANRRQTSHIRGERTCGTDCLVRFLGSGYPVICSPKHSCPHIKVRKHFSRRSVRNQVRFFIFLKHQIYLTVKKEFDKSLIRKT